MRSTMLRTYQAKEHKTVDEALAYFEVDASKRKALEAEQEELTSARLISQIEFRKQET